MAKYTIYNTDGEGPVHDNKSPYKRQNRETGKRNKWPSEEKYEEMPEVFVPEWLQQYFADMYVWGCRVRADIRELEKHSGLGHGDPGDPPAGPWGQP